MPDTSWSAVTSMLLTMAGRGRGRGYSSNSPDAKPVLSVSRGRGTHSLASAKKSSLEDKCEPGFDISKEAVIEKMDNEQKLSSSKVADDLVSMMERSRGGAKAAADLVIASIFSNEFLSRPIPVQYIIDVLTALECKKAGSQPVRDSLFITLQKTFSEREKLLSKSNTYEYEINMLILTGLTKSLKSPNDGMPYIPLLKASITWISEMLCAENNSTFIENAAIELQDMQPMIAKHKRLIDSTLLESLYINCRKAIIYAKETNKETRKILLKCLESHLTGGAINSLNSDVAKLYL